MADVDINKFRASVVRDGSKPASPGFIVSEGQDPVDPSGNGQNHLPVTIAEAATGLSITESQVLGGAGTVGQYIRGDGSLADFPESSGGGSSVSYYLNGSVAQGTIGGIAYKELNKVPILGAGTDFTINADGYIASFITDAGDPNLLEIPGGNWNFETYFSASSGGGSPTFYVELYKVNSGGTATLIASNSGFPELIAFGTNIISYFSTLAVPTTALALTDRLAIRYYVNHSGRTITLHTEDNHLCQIITTFTTGITALNGLTAQVQNFAVGTSGTDFAISSATATHTFNLPTASATNRGALSSADWSMFNAKQNALTNPVTGTGAQGRVAYWDSTGVIKSDSLFQWNDFSKRLGIGRTPTVSLDVEGAGFFSGTVTALSIIKSGGTSSQYLMADGSVSTLTNPVTGTGTTNYLPKFTGASTIGNSNLINNASGNLGLGVTPSAWVGATGLQVQYAIVEGRSILPSFAEFGANTFSDSGSRKYITSDFASRYTQYQSNHFWYTAPSGTAGSAISFTQAMTLNSSGNVLIGTTTDSGARLQVSGAGNTAMSVGGNGYSVFTGSAFSYTPNNIGLSLGYNRSGGNGESSIVWGAPAAGFNFEIASVTSNVITPRMTITSSGNVGIGTASPGYKTVIQTANQTTGLLVTTNANDSETGLYIQPDHTNGIVKLFASGGTNKAFAFLNGNTEAMRITSGGNVLIGTTTDSGENLQVKNGRSLFQLPSGTNGAILKLGRSAGAYYWHLGINGATSNFEFYDNGLNVLSNINVTTGAYTAVSDINKKKDFEDSTIGLNAILGLKPTLYRMKSESNTQKHLGFIAQEVKEYIPQAYMQNGDFIGLNEMPIIAALTKAIQELKQEIDTLKN